MNSKIYRTAAIAVGLAFGSRANAQPSLALDPNTEAVETQLRERKPTDKRSQRVRQFHEVLDNLLAEFAYDVKRGQLNTLQNIAIRRVEVSASLPNSYREYVGLLVTEQIRANSSVQVLNCLRCQTKTSKLIEGKLVISSPASDPMALKRAADITGIENFMDVVLVYHSTHMVLALQVFSTKNSEMLWSRSYNSETVRSRYQDLAIDYRQIHKGRSSDSYSPEYKYLFGLGGGRIPNLDSETTASNSTMMVLQLRATERFDRRRSEFGLMLSVYTPITSLLAEQDSSDPAAGTGEKVLEPYRTALSIHGVFVKNVLGAVEFYDQIRQGFHIAAGGMLAAGYIAPSVRLGWDLYFGRRFAVSAAANYIGKSSVITGGERISVTGGIGFELVLAFNM